eukprot:TRINITY_DN5291_c0_g1_i1.p2 TRINITY_DN5291_c0_g1~~TRINITY_DN5291_c0_g1_i1.p2  ORF type:complete len:161 (+),score=62.11 TRINITY_DN5291_c0_g1_i1:122-604(+)
MSGVASFYDLVEKDIEGRDVAYSQFKGQVVYGLNVASRCSATPHEYKRLKELGERFQDRPDLAIMAFPSGQFAQQECKLDHEIAEFARAHGPPGLIVMSKADVKGKKARPTYQYLKEQCQGLDLSWNFRGKFLVSRNGVPRATHVPEEDIPPLLAEPHQP